jgi:hypothetical protein
MRWGAASRKRPYYSLFLLPRREFAVFSFTRAVWILAAVCVSGAALADPEPDKAKPATKDQIAKWIRQLGDGDFDTREKASEELWKHAREAEAALRAAVKSDDAEIGRRATDIVERLDDGIYPDTKKELVEFRDKYRSGDDAARQMAIRGLLTGGKPGLTILLKLINTEKDDATRAQIWQQIAPQALEAMPGRLAEGDRAAVEELLDLGLGSELPVVREWYAAYWFRRGELAKRIDLLKDRKNLSPENHAALLATLYRVQGDYRKAYALAPAAKNEPLLLSILFDEGNWKDLVKLTAANAQANVPDMQALVALLQRLSGDDKSADDALNHIRDNAEQTDPWQTARALLLNGRAADGMTVLGKSKHRLMMLELLVSRYQFKEALELIDKVKDKPDDNEEPYRFDVLQARTFYLLGEHEHALKIFKSLGERIEKADPAVNNPSVCSFLIDTENKLGLRDLACEHCTSLLQRFGQEQFNIPLNDVFPERGDTSAVWWEFLRSKYPNDDPPETMKRLRSILEGKMPPKDFTALATDAVLLGRDLPEDRRPRWFLALADAGKDASADALVKDCLEKAVTAAEAIAKNKTKEDGANDAEASAALLRLADYHADKKEWEKAAEQYGRIWALDKKEPLPAFLRGHALVEAGKEKEGKLLMELAHDLPLADAAARYRFARELDKRGFADAAQEECQLIVRINGYDEPWFTEEALKALGQNARAKKDYAKASDAYARALLCHLHAEAEYRFTTGNLVVPCSYHYNRALAALAAGKLDEMKGAIQTCLALLPGDINLAIYLLPDLEKQGHKKEAAELFDKVWAVHESLCKDHPKSAWGHNNLAWLSVRCRRNLDQGLKHAKTAVELSPDNAGYLDTLAEAHFQNGDKDKALELIKKCISLDPKYSYFGRQLKRIEAGDPKVDVPE